MASGVMEVAALGRPFTLGMLYDARRDQLIPGFTLWDDKTLQEKTKERAQPSTEFHITASDSTESKSSLMDVNASLKASFLGGLIEVGGSAKYLNDKKKSDKQSRVTLQYKVTTKFKQLMLTPDGTKKSIQRANYDMKSLATHVVTGILYGANAFFVFDSEKLDASSTQNIQGSMQAALNKIPTFEIDGKGDINLSGHDTSLTDKFTCTFYGDFILERNPTTFEDAVKTYNQLPKLLGDDKENDVPLKVTLIPLKKLYSEAAEMMAEISDELVRIAEEALKDFHNLEITCNDLLEDSVVKSFPQIEEKLSTFQKLCIYFRCSLEKKLAKKLPSIRAGEEDEQELVKIFADRDKSPFSKEKLTKWIEDKEREVTTIKYFVDMLEGTKIISNQSQLDREVFKPGAEDILCFVFTSLKSTDPHLQTMARYLAPQKLEGTDSNPGQEGQHTQDLWYISDFIQMKEKAKVFHDISKALKNENMFSFILAAIADCQHKGASIYHYKNTVLVSDDFSKITDVENITDRRALMWYSCDLTLDQETTGIDLLLSEGNKKATRGPLQNYSNNPERFNPYPNVLCKGALIGRCYWEVEWDIGNGSADTAVCYKKIERKDSDRVMLGWNDVSWSLRYIPASPGSSTAKMCPQHQCNRDKQFEGDTVPPTSVLHLGVFLDWPGGTLSYYAVSSDKLTHIYTFKTKFSEPVYPAFGVWDKSMTLRSGNQLI